VYRSGNRFQSLFWWILLLNANPNRVMKNKGMFQSLFWWILLLNQHFWFAVLDGVGVSILVLMDFALKQGEEAGTCILCGVFQSLFWWILLLNFLCFPLLFFSNRVSILVLMDFALKLCFCSEKKGNFGGVSILVLMDFALKRPQKSILLLLMRSFNPCFDGFCS